MKIAIVVDPHFPVPPLQYGGTERSVAYLIDGLMKLGHDVTLFGPGNSMIDCHIIPCSKENIDIGLNPLDKDLLSLAIEKNVQHVVAMQCEFDVISWQAHFHPSMLKIFKPILLTLRNPLFHTLSKKNLSTIATMPNLFINAISKAYMEKYNKIDYIDSVYNGLPVEKFPLSAHTNGYISFIGRFSKDKQPHVALKAALALKKRIVIGARLDTFGKDYFERYCKKYMQDSLVDFHGEVTDKEKIEIFIQAEVNLHPIHFDEPFGLSVVEAGLCGTPTIAFDKGSMREIIKDGIAGFVVKNFQELLSAYPKALKLDRKKVREHFLQFNHLTMAKQYAVLFDGLVRKNKTS